MVKKIILTKVAQATIIAFTTIITSMYTAYGCSIIVVHIGSVIPIHLTTAVAQIRLFNPTTPLYLIASQSAITAYHDTIHRYTITPVAAESLLPCKEHRSFTQHSKLNKTFRNGFWNHATERFFYLYECMAHYNLEQVFHLENDVMLYEELSRLLPHCMMSCPNIGAVFDTDTRCIPSFMYISRAQSLLPLISHIAMLQANGYAYNDMESIADYRKQYGATAITALPIIMPEYAEQYPLQSQTGLVSRNPKDYYAHASIFDSLFDGAALGQYLGGIDPRNGISTPGFINESCLFNPSHITIRWIKDEQDRTIPYASCNREKVWRINNLHIHSKQLEPFYSGNAPLS